MDCHPNFTWCCAPVSCDGILQRTEGVLSGLCTKCGWTTCFCCNFTEVRRSVVLGVLYSTYMYVCIGTVWVSGTMPRVLLPSTVHASPARSSLQCPYGIHHCLHSSCIGAALCTLQSHEPASCSEMLRWVEAGGFCEGMDSDHKSKLLERTIAKKCPKCYIPIQKNEGCLQ